MSNIAILTDESGNFIGQKDRYQLRKGDMIAIAVLWLQNSRGELLLAQRSMNKKYDPGLWGPSAAGTLEPGETFISNIMKEAEEEIGLTGIEPIEMIRRSYWREDNGTGRYAVGYKAVCDWPIEKLVLQEDEVAAARWISREDLRKEYDADPSRFVGAQGLWDDVFGI